MQKGGKTLFPSHKELFGFEFCVRGRLRSSDSAAFGFSQISSQKGVAKCLQFLNKNFTVNDPKKCIDQKETFFAVSFQF